MATVKAIVLENDKKKDNTWNVKIRISHKSSDKYIKTEHYVEKWQLDKKFELKHQFIIDLVNPVLKAYRDEISRMPDINFISAQEIKDRLLALDKQKHDSSFNEPFEIDFIAFAKGYINSKIEEGKESTVTGYKTVVYSLQDYFKSDKVSITEINYTFLKSYESYLKRPREIERSYRIGKTRKFIQKGINEAGLHNHMRDLRGLFNKAKDHYNDEDKGIIRVLHYPFKKYKVGSAPVTEHRNRPISEIAKIRDVVLEKNSRAELARDLFMLSFYLVGMNAADIYELPDKIGKRIGYNRAKTRDRRKDKAFISVKVIPEAKPLLEKYAGKLQARYVNIAGLNAAINKGLAVVSTETGILNIDFYDARHTVGTEARNTCRFSLEDVKIALNQKERDISDIYVAPDWTTVDNVQSSVIKLLPPIKVESEAKIVSLITA
jgi:hypothetical protein